MPALLFSNFQSQGGDRYTRYVLYQSDRQKRAHDMFILFPQRVEIGQSMGNRADQFAGSGS